MGSFTAAADELSVTPGAVTQHIKTLEAWAETQLFIRNARGVKLTLLAEELLPGFTQAFDQLGFSVHALRNKATPQKIKVAALPAIAQLWLAPRLGLLREVAPEIPVSVVAQNTPPNLAREPFDMTLFFLSDPPGKDEVKIAGDRIFPVCAPPIAERLHSISDLAQETLLHEGAWADDWDIWLRHQPDSDQIRRTGTTHSLYSIALEEARHGGGVLIADESLVETMLERGHLVRPFAASVELPRNMVARLTPAFRQSETYEIVERIMLSVA
ncbi:LysR family transcriptional regulator [Rhodobacteraceae bacterium MYP1-1]|uniref:LysR family transcriptional regulator n=1 Tax=Halocynthiibacter styelae TaxID=2761955 RepID=A0A8J7LWH4_9RHOB|nr:LysR family transcriptional regulator [Paenihalocynthiibacter styelae]